MTKNNTGKLPLKQLFRTLPYITKNLFKGKYYLVSKKYNKSKEQLKLLIHYKSNIYYIILDPTTLKEKYIFIENLFFYNKKNIKSKFFLKNMSTIFLIISFLYESNESFENILSKLIKKNMLDDDTINEINHYFDYFKFEFDVISFYKEIKEKINDKWFLSLKEWKIDPTADINNALRYADSNGRIEICKWLLSLKEWKIDPTDNFVS